MGVFSFSFCAIALEISQLGTRFEREIALDDHFATLLSLGGEDYVVALFPHLDDQGFSREHMRREPRIDLTDALRVCGRVLFLDGSSAESIGAQTVKDRCLEAAHGRHLGVNVQWVPIVAQSVKESLIWLSLLLLHKVWRSVRRLGNLRLNCALVTEPTQTAYKQACSYGRDQFTAASAKDTSIKDQKTSFAFILQIGNFFLDDVLFARDQWFLKRDLLFTVQQLHWVERRDAWDIKVTVRERSAMADSQGIGGESLEFFSVLVCEFVVLRVHRVLLEADTKSVQDRITALQLDLIWLLLVAERLLNVNFFLFSHLSSVLAAS